MSSLSFALSNQACFSDEVIVTYNWVTSVLLQASQNEKDAFDDFDLVQGMDHAGRLLKLSEWQQHVRDIYMLPRMTTVGSGSTCAPPSCGPEDGSFAKESFMSFTATTASNMWIGVNTHWCIPSLTPNRR